jgi:uncharacterized membrane protein
MTFCPSCGTQMPEGKAFCPGCGRQVVPGAAPSAQPGGPAAPAPTYMPPEGAAATAGGLSDNLAGLLAYLFVPAILFLVLEPFRRNKFVRFHSFQCLFFAVAWIVFWIALSIVGRILAMIPLFGVMVVLVLYPLISLLGLLIVIFLMFKAYQGKKFKLPVVGDMAEKQADAL